MQSNSSTPVDQNKPPVIKPPMSAGVAVLASAGLGLALSGGIAFLACHWGFLFGGLDTIHALVGTTVFCAVVVPITAHIVQRKGRRFTWRALFVEVLVLALVGVGLLGWLQTREHLTAFMKPATVPDGI
jgi:hypothetical protein